MTPYNPSRWYRERDAKWAQMKRDGYTCQQIAEMTGYDADYIAQRVRAWEKHNG